MICQNLCISYLMFLSIASVTYISINNMKPFDLSSEAMFSGLLHIQYVLLYSLKLVYVLNCTKMEKNIYIMQIPNWAQYLNVNSQPWNWVFHSPLQNSLTEATMEVTVSPICTRTHFVITKKF